MSDHSSDTEYQDAARALKSRDTLEGTFTVDGEEYPLRVREPTLNELEEIEAEIGDDADEADAIREIASEYLVQPDVDVGAIGVGKLFSLFEGMRDAWQDSDAIDSAQDEMPLDEGNSRRSRR